jgi:hypothetical protein
VKCAITSFIETRGDIQRYQSMRAPMNNIIRLNCIQIRKIILARSIVFEIPGRNEGASMALRS